MPDYEVTVIETRRVTLRCVVTGCEDREHAIDAAAEGDVDEEHEVDGDHDVLERVVNTQEVREIRC